MTLEIEKIDENSGGLQGFQWKTEVVDEGDMLIYHDLRMVITDKDDNVHHRTVKGRLSRWGFMSDAPYAVKPEHTAERLLEEHEYLITDDQVRIPRCNIKTVVFEKQNERQIQPRVRVRGFKDWTKGEWVIQFLFWGGVVITGLLLIACFHKGLK